MKQSFLFLLIQSSIRDLQLSIRPVQLDIDPVFRNLEAEFGYDPLTDFVELLELSSES